MVSEPGGESEPSQKREPPRPRPPIIRIFGAIKRYENRRRRRTKQEKSDRDLIMARWTRRVGIFTAALVFVGVVTAVIFSQQLRVMRGQLDEMQTEQRPWISLEMQAEGPLVYDANGWNFVVKYSLNNVGKSPAISVDFLANMMPLAEVQPTPPTRMDIPMRPRPKPSSPRLKQLAESKSDGGGMVGARSCSRISPRLASGGHMATVAQPASFPVSSLLAARHINLSATTSRTRRGEFSSWGQKLTGK
jgi:hypothetical protein